MCVCVRVCVTERERQGEREGESEQVLGGRGATETRFRVSGSVLEVSGAGFRV